MAEAEAAAPEGEEPKSKKPMIMAILAILVSIILMAGAIVGTLFASGFFEKKDKAAVEEKVGAAGGHGAPAGDGHGAPAAGHGASAAGHGASGAAGGAPMPMATPSMARFEVRYVELEKDLLANLTGSKKVMQIKVAIMTRYDDRVINNIKKHEFALRSVAMDVMRQVRAEDIDAPDFRKRLGEKIRDEMNATLQKLEDFGGIEEIVFTNFIVQ